MKRTINRLAKAILPTEARRDRKRTYGDRTISTRKIARFSNYLEAKSCRLIDRFNEQDYLFQGA